MSSAGVMRSFKRRRRSSERRSVKSLVGPMGMKARAFLIQKMSMRGRAEKPRGTQPMGSLKKRRARPPAARAKKRTKFKTMTAGVWRVFWSRARWMRRFLESKVLLAAAAPEVKVLLGLGASFMRQLLQ